MAGFWFYCLAYCQDYAASWNKQVDERYAELVEEGQRPLYVLFSTLYTEHGYDATAQKITQEGISIQTKVPRHGTKAVAHTQLALSDEALSSRLDLRANALFATFSISLRDVLIEPWINYPLHVRFCIDTELDFTQIREDWKSQFSSYQFASIEFIDAGQSSQFIDEWIDNDEEALVLIVSLRLFDSPQEKEGEAFSALLLATPYMLSNETTKKAIKQQSIDLINWHRPEIGSDIEQVVQNGLLWGAKEPTELTTVWYNHIVLDQLPIVATALNEQGIKLNQIYHLDNTIGHTGDCAYFTAIALAIEHVHRSSDKQLVVCQGQEMSASVVIRSNFT